MQLQVEKWVATLCFMAAVLCLAAAGYDFARAFRMGAWPVAAGRVVYSELRMEEHGTRFRYSPDIEVEYSVNGSVYKTRSIRADSALSAFDRNWADRVLGQYQTGAAVQVHYRSENPAEVMVETWPQAAVEVVAVWGLCSLFAGVWFWKQPRAVL